MQSESVTTQQRPDPLSLIQEGMAVRDAKGKHVGKVSGLYLGAEADAVARLGATPATAAGTAPMVPGAAGLAGNWEAFEADGALPAAVQKRLQYKGFVKINGGRLHRHRYALREQVAAVDGEGVRLNVSEGDLIKA